MINKYTQHWLNRLLGCNDVCCDNGMHYSVSLVLHDISIVHLGCVLGTKGNLL